MLQNDKEKQNKKNPSYFKILDNIYIYCEDFMKYILTVNIYFDSGIYICVSR